MSTKELIPTLIREGFPFPLGVAIRRVSSGGVLTTWPEEEELLGPRTVASRRLQFSLGRSAARAALEDLGAAVAPVLRGPRGEPIWPAGTVGSITHTTAVAVAVVGRAADYAGIGIDVEEAGTALSARAAARVCSPAELTWVRAIEEESVARCIRVFSAKEAVFKAFYPIEQIWLGYRDAELEWRPAEGVFRARLRRGAGASFPEGFTCQVRSLLLGGEVFSSVWIAAEPE